MISRVISNNTLDESKLYPKRKARKDAIYREVTAEIVDSSQPFLFLRNKYIVAGLGN